MVEVVGGYKVCGGVVEMVVGSHMAVVEGGGRVVGQLGSFVGCIEG